MFGEGAAAAATIGYVAFLCGPPILGWIVARCLEKDPARRMGSVVELRRALRVARALVEDPSLGDVDLDLRDGRVVLPYGQGSYALKLSGDELRIASTWYFSAYSNGAVLRRVADTLP